MLHVDAKGFTTWPAEPMAKYFATGLTREEQMVVAATQGPTFGGVNDQKVGKTVAYSSKPTWSVVAGKDQIIPPQLQAHFADVMKSTVVKVNAGHLAMLARPREVAAAIIKAADSVK
jgi:pimeloyl-ACP methyl ester carboxylesterase